MLTALRFVTTINSPASNPLNARLMQIRTRTHARVQELTDKHTHTHIHTRTQRHRKQAHAHKHVRSNLGYVREESRSDVIAKMKALQAYAYVPKGL